MRHFTPWEGLALPHQDLPGGEPLLGAEPEQPPALRVRQVVEESATTRVRGLAGQAGCTRPLMIVARQAGPCIRAEYG
ncbi:hypothetical protein GCM10023096_01300 [Nonomuraea ferruginea]